MSFVWLALAITLAVEVPIVAVFYPRHRLRMILACVAANCLTNVSLNLVLLRAAYAYDSTLLAGESAALLFEALVYALVAPNREWSRALAASAAANLASFALGLILF
ncbi:MAG: hypothetical protein ABTD50_16675 [Polyangiaceae bacterium]|jgi:hypothetical protein